jgi:hypothetical protein
LFHRFLTVDDFLEVLIKNKGTFSTNFYLFTQLYF